MPASVHMYNKHNKRTRVKKVENNKNNNEWLKRTKGNSDYVIRNQKVVRDASGSCACEG
jgi:hypothetical protein